MISLHNITALAAEIGYWAAPAGRGSGFVTEAAEAVLDFAFGPMRLKRVEWHAAVGNTASARVAQKLGFSLEGVRRLAHELDRGERADGLLAGLLSDDERAPRTWAL